MTAGAPRVVVLGASGFLGSAIARALAARPVRLRLVARRPAPVPDRAVAEVEVRTGDLTEPGVLADAVADADAVVHLVAHTEGGWRVADDDPIAERLNLGLVRDLVDALGGVAPANRPPAVLFAGTDMQVGVTGRDRIDGTEPDQPCSAYCRQKLAAEHVLKRAAAAGTVRAVPLRLSTVYGHGADSTADDRGVVALMIRRALAGQPLTVWGDGAVRRDLVYIDDVVAAFVAALDHVDALDGRHWLIGSGRGRPLREIFAEVSAAVAEHTGRPPVPVVSVPPPAYAEPTDLQNVEVDSSAFHAVTGWAPRTPFHEGLARTVTALAPVRAGDAAAP